MVAHIHPWKATQSESPSDVGVGFRVKQKASGPACLGFAAVATLPLRS